MLSFKTAIIAIALLASWSLYLFQPTIPSTRQLRLPPTPFRRLERNILSWKPRKTGSTSFDQFLFKLAKRLNLDAFKEATARSFRFAEPTLLDARVANCTCTVRTGHVLVKAVHERPHEGRAGVILTTTRDPRDYLVSIFFHVMKMDWLEAVPQFKDKSSKPSATWWGFWQAYDLCESFRYYDGLQGCDVDRVKLRERAENIAERVDCVVDTNDPVPDARAICVKMGLEECPEYPMSNVKMRKDDRGYDELYEIEYVNRTLDRAVETVSVLREALMKRRCRLLGDKTSLGRMPAVVWPDKTCLEVERLQRR